MRCPRCGFDGETVAGGCARCGYGRISPPSGVLKVAGQTEAKFAHQYSLRPGTVVQYPLTRGEVLRQGRFRLVESLALPENQQDQGTAWLAVDSQSSQRRVILREVSFPAGFSTDRNQEVRSIALRMASLAQHPGFPRVVDTFSERGISCIVLQYPDGESLGTLLQRQGGALPERMVAEFGRQLCELLAHLARQRPPLVHACINPETIIVHPDKKRLSLIHLPLFPPKAQPAKQANAPSGYFAPEQMRGVVDPSVDLYALAATLHHAVTGYDPRERLAFFHPPARRLNPAVTPGMEAILSRALRLSPAQRYPRPLEMLKDLSSLIASYPSVVTETLNPAANSLLLDSTQMRKRSRNRSLLSVSILAGVSFIILISFLLVYFRPFNLTPASDNLSQNATVTAAEQIALSNELALETQAFQKKSIGVSDGRFAFDIFNRSDTEQKKQAALAIQHGDMSTAVNLLMQAVTTDPTDGEAQIYNEDLHILQTGAPSVSIVLGEPIDSGAAFLGFTRTELDGAYLAQHTINSENLLPHGLKLRLLIGCSGSDDNNVATVAQFIATRVSKAGNLDHIIGVVGWPYSAETTDARDIVAAVHLPLISQSASSVKLSGSSPYFFRVNPPDNLQGSTLGNEAVQSLGARSILVLHDPTDNYSDSLSQAFAASVSALGASISLDTFHGSGGASPPSQVTTVAQYQQKVVQEALAHKTDIIFLAGYDVDAIRLAHAVGNALRADPANAVLAKLKIMGGDGLDSSLVLGIGVNTDAQTAQQFPQDMRKLIFTSFADEHEWTFEKVPKSQQPSFLSDWSKTYQNSAITSRNAPDPTYISILMYDAVRVVAYAAKYVPGPLTGEAIRAALVSIGKGKVAAYQGVGGRILFDAQGNPMNKAIVLLDVVPANVNNPDGANAIHLLSIGGTFL